MIKWLARLRQPKRTKLARRPWVIVRRDVAEKWTPAERVWLNQMMNSPIWQKLLRFADDAICMDILSGAKEGQAPEFIEAMVVGRMRERDYYASMGMVAAQAEPPDPERLDPEPAGVAKESAGDNERVTYQADEDEMEARNER